MRPSRRGHRLGSPAVVIRRSPRYSLSLVREWAFIALLILFASSLGAQVDSGNGPRNAGGPGEAGGSEGADAVSESPELSFGLSLGLGVQSYPGGTGTDDVTYQFLALRPEIAYGKLGLGLDLGINYRFNAGDGNDFAVREEDWVPTEDRSFWEIYLAKIAYLRWAEKGDPLYARLGSLDDATLGNGFIVGGYANTSYLPDLRLVGLQADLDGELFGVPYLGIETVTGNLAALDLLAARFYLRPLAGTELPVISGLQIGGTFATDREPFYFAEKSDAFDGAVDSSAEVVIWGVDMRLPLLSRDSVTLATFADYVLQDESPGAMVGFGGRLLGYLLYGGQIRYLGENFIPVYFDGSYDLFRLEQYALYDAEERITPRYWGWQGTLGLALFDDSLIFRSSVEGPLGAGSGTNPTLRAGAYVGPGLLAGFTLEGEYTKRDIGSFDDLVDPADSLVLMRFGYQTGPTQIALVYRLRHDPFADGDPWQVSSGLESTIVLQ